MSFSANDKTVLQETFDVYRRQGHYRPHAFVVMNLDVDGIARCTPIPDLSGHKFSLA
jgi:hypothetical protein